MSDTATGAAPPRPWLRTLRRLGRHRSFRIGATIVLLLTLAALAAPLLSSVDPTAMQIRYRLRPPSLAFPAGTDMFGRDVMTRVLYGARLSLWIGLSVPSPLVSR